MCPGNHASADTRQSGKTRQGSPWLRRTLTEAAHGAARTKHQYLWVQDNRLAARRGSQRAILAVGHATLTISSYLLTRHTTYHDLGSNYFTRSRKSNLSYRLSALLTQALHKYGQRYWLLERYVHACSCLTSICKLHQNPFCFALSLTHCHRTGSTELTWLGMHRRMKSSGPMTV